MIKVSVPASVAKSPSVRAVLNSAMVPVRVLLPRSIDLLVRVSEVSIPTSVVSALGRVTVLAPLFESILLISGVVKVLLVNVSAPSSVLSVPVVGRVTLVAAVDVNEISPEPAVAKLPPFIVIVLVPLLTPVPPYVGDIISAFQVPTFIVPNSVI